MVCTFEHYLINVTRRVYRDRFSAERLGQAYFNELSLTRPDLGDSVRGTDLDPFYSDSVIPRFLTWVGENW